MLSLCDAYFDPTSWRVYAIAESNGSISFKSRSYRYMVLQRAGFVRSIAGAILVLTLPF
jgi:hypothetical protein